MRKKDLQNYGVDQNQAYYESIMPEMTVEQALYIQSRPYGSFPQEVYSKATAILTSQQMQYENKNKK